ncbi:uncharacterized protein LOC111830679 [Capsella rubella]|uniref:uncharacterized protein LOC111830679 n=1 Tax=Capsella rubella TaxID=81985 RepID=UPI000CD4BB3A|nr:uncharacterized protein LOC111830679 [Capsella rubella]
MSVDFFLSSLSKKLFREKDFDRVYGHAVPAYDFICSPVLLFYLVVLSRRPVYPAFLTAISLPFLLFHRTDWGNTLISVSSSFPSWNFPWPNLDPLHHHLQRGCLAPFNRIFVDLFDYNGPAFLTVSITSFEVRLAILGSQSFNCRSLLSYQLMTRVQKLYLMWLLVFRRLLLCFCSWERYSGGKKNH